MRLIQRNGEVVIKMLANVQQQDTIKPIIQKVVAVSSKVFTDEYNIYNRLTEWGYAHLIVNHSQGEYARNEDGYGFHEVHTNTIDLFTDPAEAVWMTKAVRPLPGNAQRPILTSLAAC